MEKRIENPDNDLYFDSSSRSSKNRATLLLILSLKITLTLDRVLLLKERIKKSSVIRYIESCEISI